MHEHADAETNNRAEEAHQDIGVKWELCQALIEGERWSVSLRPHMWSTSQDKGHRQHTSQDDEDVPEESPDWAPPPDKPVRSQNEPLSIELEGERSAVASCKVIPTGGDTDMSGVSDGDKDARKWPKKLWNRSKHIQEHFEQGSQGDSPRRARGDPDKLRNGHPKHLPRRPHGLSKQRWRHCSGTNTWSRGTGPGGCIGEQVELRDVKADSDRKKISYGTGYGGTQARGDSNGGVEPNPSALTGLSKHKCRTKAEWCRHCYFIFSLLCKAGLCLLVSGYWMVSLSRPPEMIHRWFTCPLQNLVHTDGLLDDLSSEGGLEIWQCDNNTYSREWWDQMY